jgi:hypothetical protein
MTLVEDHTSHSEIKFGELSNYPQSCGMWITFEMKNICELPFNHIQMSTLGANKPYLLWLSVAYFRMLCKKIHYVSGILGETTRLELPSLLAIKMIHATTNLANMNSVVRIWKLKLYLSSNAKVHAIHSSMSSSRLPHHQWSLYNW